MKFHLITTLDYELFGDGSGCIDHCLLKPTQAFLTVCDAVNAPAALFVETLEFLAMHKHSSNSLVPTSTLYPSVVQQLESCVANGHELQLHLHPQWLDAKWNASGWDLDYSKWRVGNLSRADLRDSIQNGLGWIEDALSAESTLSHANSHCKVFRAGGWTMQPSGLVSEVLAENGVSVDSTVAPGQKNGAAGDWYNFSRTPDKPWWRYNDDICIEVVNGAHIQVPILTADVGFKAHARALKEHKSQPQLPCGCEGSYAGPNSRLQTLRGKIGKVLSMGRVMLDFSTMPAWLLIEATEQYMHRFANFETSVPLVAIGHNKNFTDWSRDNFAHYMEWVAKHPDIQFSSYGRWLDTLDK